MPAFARQHMVCPGNRMAQATKSSREGGQMLNKSQLIRKELEERRSLLYQIAYSWCHQPALADDLVQETMLKALRSSRQLNNTKAVKSWLTRILANCWYDHLRSRRDVIDIDSLPHETHPRTHDTNDRQDIIDRVRNMIAQLPSGQRQVITLVDLAGFSYAEIADILEIPIGTVMSRICRARKALKLALAEYDPRHDYARAGIRRVK
jgi:RNA polymerase sigma-70 factor (ECF subfamily)